MAITNRATVTLPIGIRGGDKEKVKLTRAQAISLLHLLGDPTAVTQIAEHLRRELATKTPSNR